MGKIAAPNKSKVTKIEAGALAVLGALKIASQSAERAALASH